MMNDNTGNIGGIETGVVDFAASEKPYRVITNPKVARKLIQKGYRVCDIKPNKHFARETVFVFENTPEFSNAANELIGSSKIQRENTESESEFDCE